MNAIGPEEPAQEMAVDQLPEGMPDVSPMLAETCPGPFDDDNWLFEVKWDGYRCLTYLNGSNIFLRSRNGNSLGNRFPGLESIIKSVRHGKADNLIADGEIVAFQNGIPSFSYLKSSPHSAIYVAFDLVYLNGQSLLQVPLINRRSILSELFSWERFIYFSQACSGKGSSLFNFARERDLEGVMAKRKDSLYFPGKRTRNWLKIRNFKEDEFWVLGYLPSPGREIGSLVVAREVCERKGVVFPESMKVVKQGSHNREGQTNKLRSVALEPGDIPPADRKFSLVGRVSSGLNAEREKTLLAAFGPFLGTKHLTVQGKLPRSVLSSVRWIEPYFGVRVQYTEITPDGNLRHPVLRGIIGKRAGPGG
jgi:bifunctional non-homologous end joining protein LigD